MVFRYDKVWKFDTFSDNNRNVLLFSFIVACLPPLLKFQIIIVKFQLNAKIYP